MLKNVDIKLEDFLPDYPIFDRNYSPKDDENDIFNLYKIPDSDKLDTPQNIIYRKKEFLENKLDQYEKRPEASGIPLKHQSFISRFLSPFTPNNEILLFHQVGTGKTCSSIVIAEINKNYDHNLKKTLVLVKGTSLKKNFIRELAFQCTSGQYIPDNFEHLTQGEQVARLNKKVNSKYNINTFEIFCKMISKYSDEFITKEYSNRIVIIDEIHNIRIQNKKIEKNEVDVYGQIHRFLHLINNRKIILLSGTPMRDKPDEFSSVMNLILPLNQQLPTKQEFMNTFYKGGKLINVNILRNAIQGRISYLRSMDSNVIKISEGKITGDMKKIPISTIEMKEEQKNSYIKAFKRDTKEEKNEEDENGDGLYDKSRQASMFVFPDGSFGSEGFNNKEWITETKGEYKFTQKFRDILTDNGKASYMEIINNIEKYSCKMAYVLRQIMKEPTKNCFVYSKYVKGSGAIIFGECIKLLNFEKFTSKTKNIKRRAYTVITSETASDVETDKVINELNKSIYKNSGHVIIGSQIIGEGKTLKNIRSIFILTPHWNNSETEQAIGRGIRIFSHDDLDVKDRNVTITRLCAMPDNFIKSVDYMMYKLSEDKDILIKQIERIVMEESVDCLLNKKRNRLEIDVNNSRECQYMQCDYTCRNTRYNSIDDIKNDDVINDTFNLYYSNKNRDEIIEALKSLFRKQFSYDLSEILNNIPSISHIVMLQTLKYVIDKNMIFKNKYGMRTYLKEDNNLFFLVDDLKTPPSFFLEYYNRSPQIHSEMGLKDYTRYLQYKSINNIIKNFENESEIYINNTLDILDPKLQELFIEKCITASEEKLNKNKELKAIIMNKFSSYLSVFQNKIISSLLKDKNIGELRAFDKKEKRWHNYKHEKKFVRDVDIDTFNLKTNKYGYYGIYKDNQFKVFKIKKDIKDTRKESRGAVCTTIVPRSNILKIILDLKVEPPHKTIIDNRENAISKILKSQKDFDKEMKKYTKEELTNLSNKEFHDVYYWYYYADKKTMCNALKDWFENKNLLQK